MSFLIHHGSAVKVLQTMPAESVHCVVTSPPYWALRDYGTATWEGGAADCDHKIIKSWKDPKYPDAPGQNGSPRSSEALTRTHCRCGAKRVDEQLGLEQVHDCIGWATGQPCHACYICRMVEVFAELRRVLRSDGTCWVNIGDSYAGSWGAQGRQGSGEFQKGRTAPAQRAIAAAEKRERGTGSADRTPGLKAKDLCAIPYRLALALQASGWYWRDTIVWRKPAPMPESVRDRCTKSWEPILMLSKARHYYFDDLAIAEEVSGDAHSRGTSGVTPKSLSADRGEARKAPQQNASWSAAHRGLSPFSTRNRRNVWELAPMPTADAHYATFPLELPELCLLAGTGEHGVCPKCGSAWRRMVERIAARQPSAAAIAEVEKAIAALVPDAGGPELQNGAAKWNQAGEQAAARRMEESVKAGRAAGRDHDQPFEPPKTLGWRAGCNCYPAATLEDTIPATVLDPFAGSGTTGLACLKNGRRFVGIELNAEYIEIAHSRAKRHYSLLTGTL